MSCTEININGIIYVPKELKVGSLPYVVVRCRSAGVFAGYLKERRGQEADLINSRRIFYWDGAASLSQLAQEGVSKPQNCKFPCEEPEKTVFEVIEITPATEKAKKSIAGVPIWEI
jgi:hypothetical protein